MVTDMGLTSNFRRIFLVFFLVCVALVVVQYRFNYFSMSYCGKNDNRFVKRVVERVYYELPPTKKSDNNNDDTSSTSPYQMRSVGKINDVTSAATNSSCQPEKHVVFLKTHKTGSSTITNILNRYSDKNEMTVLLPKDVGYYSFDWPNKFRLSSAAHIFHRPNFLANHARYSRKSLSHLFPHDSTTYISVLRHPVSQWESTFQYMSFPYILGIADKKDPLKFFLDNPPSNTNIKEIAKKFPSLYLIRNPLFYDLGLDYQYYENTTFIRRAVNTLNNDFDLVLIMEHFDESLTLLRRRLCWSIDDVVYFKMNERLNKHKRRVLTQSQIEKIKQWNNADVALYNFFVEKFWKQVENEGPGFHDDVLELKRRKAYYSKICIEKEAVEEAYSTVFVKGYKMRSNLTGETKQFCQRMLRNELRYMDYFRSKRTKWKSSLEGVTIENFDQSTEEADIFVENFNIKISNYVYGVKNKKTKKKFNGVHTFEEEHTEAAIATNVNNENNNNGSTTLVDNNDNNNNLNVNNNLNNNDVDAMQNNTASYNMDNSQNDVIQNVANVNNDPTTTVDSGENYDGKFSTF